MRIAFLIAVYFVVWWTVLFAVLPWGVRTQAEAGSVVPGTSESAPAAFPLGRVVMLTTLVSAIVMGVFWGLIHFGILDFEALGERFGY